ncbi:hypothetical protein LJR225_000719 [Phenylobacterium sp. LjRoot225]|uniref:hypothetical protein n=1 Tax=Phenylobacterium sp. LjRoot225 TaxID=3342285 RepID=UPI003ECE7D76
MTKKSDPRLAGRRAGAGDDLARKRVEPDYRAKTQETLVFWLHVDRFGEEHLFSELPPNLLTHLVETYEIYPGIWLEEVWTPTHAENGEIVYVEPHGAGWMLSGCYDERNCLWRRTSPKQRIGDWRQYTGNTTPEKFLPEREIDATVYPAPAPTMWLRIDHDDGKEVFEEEEPHPDVFWNPVHVNFERDGTQTTWTTSDVREETVDGEEYREVRMRHPPGEGWVAEKIVKELFVFWRRPGPGEDS